MTTRNTKPTRTTRNPISLTAAQKKLFSQAPNLYLIGLMGAGKSTAGKLLARALGRHFYDSDEEIIARTGASIPTIFEIEGEEGFRVREQRMIAELCEKNAVVLGTGGGAVLREANQIALKNSGWVIYLSTTPERLYNRTRYDRNRPLLQTEDPLATLTRLYEVRHPIYESLADIVVKTGGGHVNRVVNDIIKAIELKLHAQSEAATAPAEPSTE